MSTWHRHGALVVCIFLGMLAGVHLELHEGSRERAAAGTGTGWPAAGRAVLCAGGVQGCGGSASAAMDTACVSVRIGRRQYTGCWPADGTGCRQGGLPGGALVLAALPAPRQENPGTGQPCVSVPGGQLTQHVRPLSLALTFSVSHGRATGLPAGHGTGGGCLVLKGDSVRCTPVQPLSAMILHL